RLGQPLRRQLGGVGELDDDAEQLARAEGDANDAADLEPVHRRRPAVVERSPQSTGSGQWLDPEDGHQARLCAAGDDPSTALASPPRSRMLPAVSLNLSPGEQVI